MISRLVSTTLTITAHLTVTGCNSSKNSTPAFANDPVADASLPVENHLDSDDKAPSSGYSTSEETPDSTVAVAVSTLELDTAYTSLLTNLAGYQLETLAEEVVLISDLATVSAISSTALENRMYSVEDQGRTVDLPVNRTLYSCELGGELTLEMAQLNRNDLFYSRDSLFTQYIYDQCRLGAEQGERVLDGTLQTMANDIKGHHFTKKEKQVNWTSFKCVHESGDTIEADATLDINEFGSFNFEISRQVEIRNYSISNDNAIIERISDATFEQSSSIDASHSEQEFAMTTQGQFVDRSGVTIQIDTKPRFSHSVSIGEPTSQSVSVTGQLMMRTDEGSSVLLTATDSSNSTAWSVDVSFLDTDGQTSTLNAQNLVKSPFYAVPLIQ